MSIPAHLSDRYELGEILGFGGMSEVHFGRDVRLRRDVAVKVLRADLARDPSFYLRFRREAQNAAALNHPAIVAVYDTGEAETATGPLPYIVMEYVDGVTLRDLIRDDGPMEPGYAIEVIADACQALNFSHQHGIIHRDVKPANVMISTAGAVKVMDFGIARTLSDTTGGNRLTATATVIGTAAYLSPEQASGEPVDARSDIYSLGCVLYEIITGQPPFVGDSPVAVAYQHVRKDPEPPSQLRDGISPELDAVVLKALTKNPENRYQSAAEMRADLIRVRGGEAPHAPKVFTNAERTDLTSGPFDGGRGPQWLAQAAEPRDGRPMRRWLLPAAVLAVLAVVITVAVNALGTREHAVPVPDVHGQTQQAAIATLQSLGFKSRGPIQKSDPSVPPGHVIDTDPGAHTALAGGDEITVDVSSGPEQHEVPNCSRLSLDDCVRRLAAAGFSHSKPSSTASATIPQNLVIATIPAAGQISEITNDVTIQLSTGPDAHRVPDVVGQTADRAAANLKTAGFQVVLTAPVDSTLPAGQVISTDPPVGTYLSGQSAITLKVSLGNQFTMPNLVGKTYLEVVPYLQDFGFVGPLLNGGDVPGSDDTKNRVVRQDPPAGTGVNRDGTITLNYGS
ncbi:MAG: eukaryotic-like serine/threonine-protein kinase [Mycobacterium sp.]|nr:eukaryotic-like serine/threonine-protein kinase [Mycobacterium sp.]